MSIVLELNRMHDSAHLLFAENKLFNRRIFAVIILKTTT